MLLCSSLYLSDGLTEADLFARMRRARTKADMSREDERACLDTFAQFWPRPGHASSLTRFLAHVGCAMSIMRKPGVTRTAPWWSGYALGLVSCKPQKERRAAVVTVMRWEMGEEEREKEEGKGRERRKNLGGKGENEEDEEREGCEEHQGRERRKPEIREKADSNSGDIPKLCAQVQFLRDGSGKKKEEFACDMY